MSSSTEREKSSRLRNDTSDKNWLETLKDFFLLPGASRIIYQMFKLRMKPITIRRQQILLSMSALLVAFFWIDDFLLNKPPELFVAFAYWRGLTVLGLIGGVLGLQFSPVLRDYRNTLYVCVITFVVLSAAVLFGSIKDLNYPLFEFFTFITPMFSIVLCVGLLNRLAVAVGTSSAFAVTYLLMDPAKYDAAFVAQFISPWATVVLLNTVVGHAIFYYDFWMFRTERELQLQQQKIEDLAKHDQLTSLLNRTEFMELARKAFARARRYDSDLSVAMIDLDHFKEINDTYGHLAGDDVLEQFGELVQGNFRNADIACRYGGEEFFILMPQTAIDGASTMAERLKRELSLVEFKDTEGETFSVTCSIGLVELDDETDTLEGLLENADQKLYEAKRSGRNQICKSV